MEQTMWNIWFGAMAVLFVAGIVGRIYENDFEKKFGRSLFHPSAIVAVFLVSMGTLFIGYTLPRIIFIAIGVVIIAHLIYTYRLKWTLAIIGFSAIIAVGIIVLIRVIGDALNRNNK